MEKPSYALVSFPGKVLSMKSHDNLNFYFSACALWVFFAGNQLEEELWFEKNDRISQI